MGNRRPDIIPGKIYTIEIAKEYKELEFIEDSGREGAPLYFCRGIIHVFCPLNVEVILVK